MRRKLGGWIVQFDILGLSQMELIYLLSYFLAGYAILVVILEVFRRSDTAKSRIKLAYGPIASLHVSLILASECSSHACSSIIPYVWVLLAISLTIQVYVTYRIGKVGKIDTELLVISSATVSILLCWISFALAIQFIWVLLAIVAISWLLMHLAIRRLGKSSSQYGVLGE